MPRNMRITTTAISAFALAALVGCGTAEQSDDEQIRDVVPQYIDAIADGDLDTALGLTCADAQEETTDTVEQAEGESIVFESITSIDVSGDTAEVEVEFSEDGGSPQTETLTMAREDGEWLVCG